MKIGKHERNRIGIAHVLLLYWIVLVAWQNIARLEARSGIDMIIKIGLLGMLTAFYMLHAKKMSKNIIMVFLLAIVLLLVLWISGDAFSIYNVIAYLYPVLLVGLSFGVGNDFQINRREFLFFLHGIIATAMYMAVYAIIFCTDRFLGALTNTLGYGAELTSFLTSNHEYGMYLVYAITACIVCVEMKREEPMKKRRPYFFFMVIFIINLFLTYSRTSILAMAAIVIVYCFINAKSKMRKWMIFALVLAGTAVALSTALRETIELIVFKSEDDALGARGDMFTLAMDLFKRGNIIQKCFGYGIRIRDTFEYYTTHASVHNAYLQVLLCYGIIGVVFFVGMLLSQLKACILLYRKSKIFSVTFCAFILAAMAMMATNTAVIFTSQIDSFFLTMVAIIVPKYVRNAIQAGTFDA